MRSARDLFKLGTPAGLPACVLAALGTCVVRPVFRLEVMGCTAATNAAAVWTQNAPVEPAVMIDNISPLMVMAMAWSSAGNS